MKWTGLTFELIGFVGAGFLIGFVLDQIWERQGVFQAGGIVLAFLLWVILVWQKLRS